jgi:hypothetical protein
LGEILVITVIAAVMTALHLTQNWHCNCQVVSTAT